MTATELPKLKGSDAQVKWGEDIRAKASALSSHPRADERVRAMAAAVGAMPHAKMLIDLKDVIDNPKALYGAYTTGQQIAQAVRDNAGKVKEKDIDAVLGRVSPESAAFAFAALNPDASSYDGYGQTALPWFTLWLMGKYPLPAAGGK